jgi:hypothetical protein
MSVAGVNGAAASLTLPGQHTTPVPQATGTAATAAGTATAAGAAPVAAGGSAATAGTSTVKVPGAAGTGSTTGSETGSATKEPQKAKEAPKPLPPLPGLTVAEIRTILGYVPVSRTGGTQASTSASVEDALRHYT